MAITFTSAEIRPLRGAVPRPPEEADILARAFHPEPLRRRMENESQIHAGYDNLKNARQIL